MHRVTKRGFISVGVPSPRSSAPATPEPSAIVSVMAHATSVMNRTLAFIVYPPGK